MELIIRLQLPESAAVEASAVELVGLGEAAEILGVTKQRVHQLKSSPAFPRPIALLKATPVWQKASMENYAKTRRRSAGRPVGS